MDTSEVETNTGVTLYVILLMLYCHYLKTVCRYAIIRSDQDIWRRGGLNTSPRVLLDVLK